MLLTALYSNFERFASPTNYNPCFRSRYVFCVLIIHPLYHCISFLSRIPFYISRIIVLSLVLSNSSFIS